MDWTMILTGLGTVAAVSGVMYGFLRNFKIDINSHLDRIEKRFDRMESRMDRADARHDKIEVRLDGHAARLDQLYQMFCDLLKERK